MRNYKIDFLRFIGLIMIILAHSSPDPIVFQIRNFDVPLMVFISGVSFNLSYKANVSYRKYVLKRIKRLALPVWVFLTFYFIISIVCGINYSIIEIATSYLFLSGIGYVWIIRVFLMVALIAPLLYWVSTKIKSNLLFLLLLIISYIVYDVIQYNLHSYFENYFYLQILDRIIFYIIPYSLIYLLGMRIHNFTKKTSVILMVGSSLIFAFTALYLSHEQGQFVQTNNYKYPISFYYLTYALAITLILWLWSDKLWNRLKESFIRNIILFIAQNSIWIYLWHIPYINLINKYHHNYIIEYLFVVLLSVSTVGLQRWILDKMIFPAITKEKLKKDLRYILTG